MARTADCVAVRREIADSVKNELRGVPGLRTVVLFGSTARGDATERSDVDLLAIMSPGGDASPVREIGRHARHARVSLVLHDLDSFEQLKNDDWLFVRHLHDEGIVLWEEGTGFRDRSAVAHPGDRAVVAEIRRSACELTRLRELHRYGTDFLFPLADTYAAAKRVAMLANARCGVSVFQREQAFATCAQIYDKTAREIGEISRLAPFYARTRGDREAEGAFSSDGASKELLEAVASLQRVIETVSVG